MSLEKLIESKQDVMHINDLLYVAGYVINLIIQQIMTLSTDNHNS